VLHEDGKTFGLLAVILHTSTRALDNLGWVAFGIDLAESNPLSELGVLWNLQERNALLLAKTLDELDVVAIVAVLGQDNKLGLSLLNASANFVESARQRVASKRLLEDLLQSSHQIHWLPNGWGSLNNWCFYLSIRHGAFLSSWYILYE
jgi:hypothetical protein